MKPSLRDRRAAWRLAGAAILCFLRVTLVAQPVTNQPADEIRIVGLHGKVEEIEIAPANLNRWLKTGSNQVLRSFDRVRTGPNSRVSIRWSADSVATFAPRTEIEVLPPPSRDHQAGLHVIRGLFAFFHRERPGRIRIVSRGAVAGIDGTEFVFQVEPVGDTEETTLFVIDGRVSFANEQDSLVVTNGQQAVARPGVAPALVAGFVANNILQWAFYYPAVLDLADLKLTADENKLLGESLAAYRQGDLHHALETFPTNRPPRSDPEKIYQAALLLSVGQIEPAEKLLASTTDDAQRLANALRQLLAAVTRAPVGRGVPAEPPADPSTATELLAASYYEQSKAHGDESLRRALDLARKATRKSPDFGYAWARVAELELSFGRQGAAREAVEKSLELAPRNAQALATKGFLLAGENKTRDAIDWFNKAIAADSALGNAWLGRGLARIRRGDSVAGREDLLIAAALEPQRSELRSYLGKAHVHRGELTKATHELYLARNLDPNDPTPYLYSALLKGQQNRINEAIDDLEKSKELNDNRMLYRSRLLLDQDRAVRSANLARIYADAGLEEVAVREASRAVAADYGNFSSHYFLANSYDELRRANIFDLRYEPTAFNEYLLANIMGPADGTMLAQPLAQQDYNRLFQQNYLGFSSRTEFLSRGAWEERAVQYGTIANSAYALEVEHAWDPGEGANASSYRQIGIASFKQRMTPKDSIFLQAFTFTQVEEDTGQKFNPDFTVPGLRTRQKQEPTLIAGLDRQWNEANRTLFLASRVNVSFDHHHPRGPTYLLPEFLGSPDGDLLYTDLTQEFEDQVTVDTFDLQHLNRFSRFQTVVGIRFEDGVHRISNRQTINVGNAPGSEIYFGQKGQLITNQSIRLHAQRISPYVYEHIELLSSLWLIGGILYDYQEAPRNMLFAPVSDQQDFKDQFSPRGAIVWTPTAHSAARAAYTRSLGGVGFAQSARLEPTQLAGFVQNYRDVIPPAIAGATDASRIDTADLSLEHRFPTRTYLALGGQLLRSALDHDVGVWQRDALTSEGPGIQLEEDLRYQERSLNASLHQLFTDYFTAGIRYRLSEARLKRHFRKHDPDIVGGNNHHSRGTLQTIMIDGLFRHPTGFFVGAEGLWWTQDLNANLKTFKEDEVCQINVLGGYRSPRRYVEVTVGLLNIADKDYRLHPVNLFADRPRERTFFTRVQLNF